MTQALYSHINNKKIKIKKKKEPALEPHSYQKDIGSEEANVADC
jgi:hypothetical protein